MSGTSAVSTDRVCGVGLGIAMVTATASGQRSPRNPATREMAAAMASRAHSGPASAAQGPRESARWLSATRRSSHADHAPGPNTRDAQVTAAVTPRAMPRLRHSRRAANHRRHTPGVTLVSRMKAACSRPAQPHDEGGGDEQVDVAREDLERHDRQQEQAPRPSRDRARQRANQEDRPGDEERGVREQPQERCHGQEHWRRQAGAADIHGHRIRTPRVDAQ